MDTWLRHDFFRGVNVTFYSLFWQLNYYAIVPVKTFQHWILRFMHKPLKTIRSPPRLGQRLTATPKKCFCLHGKLKENISDIDNLLWTFYVIFYEYLILFYSRTFGHTIFAMLVLAKFPFIMTLNVRNN